MTVILPVRNGSATIAAALSSTLRALPHDATLTVLDDGSTDDTAALLNHVDDPRLIVLTSKDGTGVAAGLNHLLARTDSEFVARMDADDVTLPWRFTRQLHALQSLDLDVTFTTVTLLKGRVPRPTAPLPLSPQAFPLHLLLTNPVAHPTMLGRRSALETVGGYRRVPSEDYDLWLRMSLNGARLHRSAIPGLLYRVHDQQVTASTQWRRSSWADAETQDAYRALSEQCLGAPLPRLLTLASDPHVTEAEFERHLRQLRARIADYAPALPVPDRWYLNRTLTARFSHARTVFARSSGDGSPQA